MHRHHLTPPRTLMFFIVILATVLTAAAPAGAAAPTKLEVLSGWTQTSAASANAWNAARTNRAAWASYAFDWSTDSCSDSPDNPLGFDFDLSCQRHDFGYRNYRAAGLFAANKDRVDSAFYADLQRRCAGYATAVRPACLSLAWTYYEAVHHFGSLDAVSPADLDRARVLKADGLKAAR